MSGEVAAVVASGDDASPNHPRVILVVDDDPVASRAIAEMVEHLGQHVVVCGNASAALAHIHRGTFDLLLIDYRMPELTGLDLLSMLRLEDCQVPVVMMTGYSATDDRVSAEKLGMAGILHKPIRIEALAGAIGNALRAGSAAQQLREAT